MITPVEAVGKINREKAIIVDLRESETYDAGHLVGARNLPASKIKEDGIKGLPKNKAFPVILVCASGVTARKYAKTFRDEGYENVFVLDGGIGGWVKAEFPIERKDGVVV